jgi:D-inositol-3-phosphate glycosyltransferase
VLQLSNRPSAKLSNSRLAMFCDSIGIHPPKHRSAIRTLLSRLKANVVERAGLNLGARNAVRDLYSSLLQHSSQEVLLLSTPAAKEELQREVDWLARQRRLQRSPHVADISAAPEALFSQPLCCFEPLGIRPALIDIRQSFSKRPFPITWAHHTISYRELLGDMFLPLLLSGTLPCDSVVCSSHAARKAIAAILDVVADRVPTGDRLSYRGRIDVVPFGVDTETFRPMEQKTCRRIFGLPLDATIFLCLGRISASDKADLLPLVMAVDRVKKLHPTKRVLLVIAGNPRGEYSSALKREIRERQIGDCVRLLPHLAEGEKPYLFNAADVFVSAADSIQECFGLVLLEAMASGVPQVVSDWNGYRDLVAHQETGFLVPTVWAQCDEKIIREGTLYPSDWWIDHFQLGQSVSVDSLEMTRYLSELATNTDLRRRMSTASRLRAQSLFDWRNIVTRYQELWTELNAIAFGLPDIDRSVLSHRRPEYFRCFSHYATINLTDHSRIAAADFGMSPSNTLPLPYRDLFPGFQLYPDCSPDEILSALRAAGGALSMGELLNLVGKGLTRSEVLRQVMWMLKYGYLAPVQEPEFRSSIPEGDAKRDTEFSYSIQGV